jgi:hypothetical protein
MGYYCPGFTGIVATGCDYPGLAGVAVLATGLTPFGLAAT